MEEGAKRITIIRRIRARLAGWSLSKRFALAGGAVMVLTMLAIGQWVTSKITANAIRGNAAATALFMDSFISPLIQELAEKDTLSIGPIRALEEMLGSPSLSKRVVSIKIWKPDGLIAFASDISIIGTRIPPSDKLKMALSGVVTGGFDEATSPDSAFERKAGVPLLEIYSPIRENWTGNVIAVAEFYENATDLMATIRRARLQGWMITIVATSVIGFALYGIVDAGSREIDRQRRTLEQRYADAQRMSAENLRLRGRVERASSRVSEITEAHLRQVSADLHDGPAQLIGLASLRLDALGGIDDDQKRRAEISSLREVLGDAMRDIRVISRGLSLPELEALTLDKVAKRAISAHETRTGEEVELDMSGGARNATMAVKACLFRVLQEGLNNAYRHAPGAPVTVRAHWDADKLRVAVENGRAVDEPRNIESGGMGLVGLKERIESLGGTFRFAVDEDKGARLSAELELTGDTDHA